MKRYVPLALEHGQWVTVRHSVAPQTDARSRGLTQLISGHLSRDTRRVLAIDVEDWDTLVGAVASRAVAFEAEVAKGISGAQAFANEARTLKGALDGCFERWQTRMALERELEQRATTPPPPADAVEAVIG